MQYFENKRVRRIAVITSIHDDFDSRIWKHTESLSKSGILVDLISPWIIKDSNKLNGIEFHSFKRIRRRWQRPWRIPQQVFGKLLPILRHVDIVHFHDIDILPWMALISSIKPVVYDIHENYEEEMLVRYWIPKPFRRPMKLCVKIWHKVFVRMIHNLVLAVPHQECEFNSTRLNRILMHNYASLQLLEAFRPDYSLRPNRIIFTGAHYFENGSFLLLEIAHRMKMQKISAEIIVTDRFDSSQFREDFHQKISNRKLDNIRVIPSVPSSEIMQLLNQATIGISPNLKVRKQELAIPTKLFEYMAAALPIVTSDLPYQRDLIMRYNVGILANPENPDSFVSAIAQLISDKPLAESIGRNGQSVFMEHFTWEAQIPSLLTFYEQIVK